MFFLCCFLFWQRQPYFFRLIQSYFYLNIKPHKGRLTAQIISVTKKNVIREIVQKMVENAENGTDYSGKCFISMSACREDAEAVAQLVEEKFPKLDGKVLINNIGGLIGAHTGPGTVALFFWGDERVD
ncbi:MAG: DegV family protein [Clostridia bacterium]|nr:DegV family protein [Clostridia bacterium]